MERMTTILGDGNVQTSLAFITLFPIFSVSFVSIRMLPSLLSLAMVSSAIYLSRASSSTVSIPPELGYLLPPQYSGGFQLGFVDTNTTSKADNDLLAKAQVAPFVSYDDEFLQLLGPDPTIRLVASRPIAFAGEAGVWVPDRNEVWFTSNTDNDSHSLEILDLRLPKSASQGPASQS